MLGVSVLNTALRMTRGRPAGPAAQRAAADSST
jgi:hypothetical protein